MENELFDAVVVENGLDPLEYLYDPNTDRIRKRPQRLEPLPAEQPQDTIGYGETIARNAAEAALPTAAGMAAGAGASALLRTFLPQVGWPVAIGGPIVAGLAGAAGTALVQDELAEIVAPEVRQRQRERLAEGQEQHPWTSFLSQAIPGAAATAGTGSIAALGKAGSGAWKSLTRIPLMEAEKQAMLNVGISGGAQAGIEAGQQALQGEFDPGRIAASAGLGLLMPEPNALGKKLGLRASGDIVEPAPVKTEIVVGDIPKASTEPTPATNPAEALVKVDEPLPEPSLDELDFSYKQRGKELIDMLNRREAVDPVLKGAADKVAARVEDAKTVEQARSYADKLLARTRKSFAKNTPEEQIDAVFEEVTKPKPRRTRKPKESPLSKIGKREPGDKPLETAVQEDIVADFEIDLPDSPPVKAVKALPKKAVSTSKAKARVAVNKIISDIEGITEPKANFTKDQLNTLEMFSGKDPEAVKAAYKASLLADSDRIMGRQSAADAIVEDKVKAEASWAIPTREASDSTGEIKFQISSRFAEQASRILAKYGRPADYWAPQNADIRESLATLAGERGISMIHELAPMNEAGMYDPVARSIALSENAKLDSGFHEIAHAYNRDVLSTGTAVSQNIVRNALRLANQEANAMNKRMAEQLGRPLTNEEFTTPEELFTSLTGERAASLVIARKDGALWDKAKPFWEDFKSAMKDRFGIADLDDLVRLQARSLLDAPITNLTGAQNSVPPNITPIMELIDTVSDDVNRYQVQSGLDTNIVPPEASEQRAVNRKPRINMGMKGLPYLRSATDNVALKLGATGEYLAKQLVETANTKDRYIGQSLNKAIALVQLNTKSLRNPDGFDDKTMRNIVKYLQERSATGDSTIQLGEREMAFAKQAKKLFADAKAEQAEAGLFSVEHLGKRNPAEIFPNCVSETNSDNGLTSFFDANKNLVGVVDEAADKVFLHPKVSEDFFPTSTVKGDVLRFVIDAPGSDEALRLKREWIDWKAKALSIDGTPTAKNKQAAIEAYAEFLKNNGSRETPRFVDLRTERESLPPSWREDSIMKTMRSWFTRYAWDMAYYKHLEGNDLARGILSLPDQFNKKVSNVIELPDGTMFAPVSRSQKDLKFIFDVMNRNYTSDDLLIDSMNRVVKSAMLQSLTGVKDTLTVPGLIAPYLPLRDLPNIVRGIMNTRAGIKRGLEAGVIQPSTVSAQENTDAWQSEGWMTDVMNNFSEKLYRYSGRELFEKTARGIAMHTGYLTAVDGYNRGDMKFFKDMDIDVAAFKAQLAKATPEQQLKMEEQLFNDAAAELVRKTQGTYDFRGLPEYVIRGKLSPFLSLSKWNIERANNFAKSVVNPAMNGDFKPLIVATMGSWLTGEMLVWVTEQLTGRRPNFARWSELTQPEATLADFHYRVMSLASISGYTGIMADILKIPDEWHYKNASVGLDFQLENAVKEVAMTTRYAAQAIEAGENPYEVIIDFIAHNANAHVQNIRLFNRFTESIDETTKRREQNQRKDLKIYKVMTGQPVPDQTGIQGNPFLNKHVKEFKQTGDLNKAAGLLKEKILPRMKEEAKTKQDLKQDLSGLKSLSVSFLPSPENDPMAFAQYIEYIEKAQGPEKARELMRLGAEKYQLNQAKKGMVPQVR